ncbi:MAG: RDD family protein [Anaerococcus sp.]|nr:RDD family protein [Anaerococcus sp.]
MTDKSLYIREERDYRFAYGGFFIRLIAYLIDSLVIGSIFAIIRAYVDLDLSFFSFSLDSLIRILITLSYFFLMTLLTEGRTLGKMLTGLRVVSLTGEKLSLSQIFLREVCGRYVQNKILILYIFVGFTPKKQSVFDILLDTTVVKEEIFDSLYGDKI